MKRSLALPLCLLFCATAIETRLGAQANSAAAQTRIAPAKPALSASSGRGLAAESSDSTDLPPPAKAGPGLSPAVLPPPVPPVPPTPPVPGRPVASSGGRGGGGLRIDSNKLQDAFSEAKDAVEHAMGGLKQEWEIGMDRFNTEIDNLLVSRTGGGRVLFVPDSPPDADKLKQADEDLNIMARLLAKVLARKGSDASENSYVSKATVSDRSRSVRHLHLEGQGALFLFRVNYPLIAPENLEEGGEAKPAKTSPWDDTWRELYGKGREGKGEVMAYRSGGESIEPFDGSRVDALKADLTEALKHASNMRHLKPEETVTVMLLGPAARAGKTVTRVFGKKSAPEVELVKVEADKKKITNLVGYVNVHGEVDGARSTTLYLRAKKSDIDAFAKATLDAEAFRKRVKTLAY